MDEQNQIHRSRQPVYNKYGKTCGYLWGDRLRKRVKSSLHRYQYFNGWAWDISILKQANKEGVVWTEVFDTESRTLYRATLDDFWHYGLEVDHGFGRQLCLPIEYWEIHRKETETLRMNI